MYRIEIETENPTIRDLCQLYWDMPVLGEFTHKVAEIELVAKSNEIYSGVSAIVADHASCLLTEWICPNCEAPRSFSYRKDLTNFLRHARDLADQPCPACHELLIAEDLAARRTLLAEGLESARDTNAVAPLDLTMRDAILLTAAIRHYADEDLTVVDTARPNREPFCPTGEMEAEVLRELHAQRLLCPSPRTAGAALTWNEEGGVSFPLFGISWEVPTKPGIEDLETALTLLEKRLSEPDEEDRPDIFELMAYVSLGECLDCLDFLLDRNRLSLQPGKKTLNVLKKITEKFSVAEAYNFIWSATTQASAYARQIGDSRRAANSIVSRLEGRYERTLANEWETKPYRRNYDSPQSTLSRTLYNTLLGTDDGGFHLDPESLRKRVLNITTKES